VQSIHVNKVSLQVCEQMSWPCDNTNLERKMRPLETL